MMSDMELKFATLFFLILCIRIIYVLATGKKIKLQPLPKNEDEWGNTFHDLKHHGLFIGDIGYHPEDK